MTMNRLQPINDQFNGTAADTRRKAKKKPLPPLSLRLTIEERSRLEYEADGQPLSAYIRSRLFNDKASPRRRHRKPVSDHEALARVLAKLGQSGLAQNMAQIAKSAEMGTLSLGPELQRQLSTACADIAAIRRSLIAALGLKLE